MATDAPAPDAAPQTQAASAVLVCEEAPVPLSFPAILRNPGVSHRFAHLHADQTISRSLPVKKSIKRDDNEGKRWVRRKDNGMTVITGSYEYHSSFRAQPASLITRISCMPRRQTMHHSSLMQRARSLSLCLRIYPAQ